MANSESHVHQPRLHRFWEFDGTGAWKLTYGDTTLTIEQRLYGLLHGGDMATPPPPTDGQIRRTLAKAIRKHDKGSQPLPPAKQPNIAILEQFSSKAATSGKWGTDILKELTK